MATRDIHIIGGGMTGFTLALRLVRRGIPVVVHEMEGSPGGLASGSAIAGIPVDRFYHCVLPTDDALLALLSELGLDGIIRWTRARTGFLHQGRLLEMTTTRDFLTFPAINMIDRFKLAWTLVYCGYFVDWRDVDEESVGTFLRRVGGQRLFETVWEPLLLSKLGPSYERFSATFIWATARRMLSARKAKGRSEKLGFVRGQYGKVFSALKKEIELRGGIVRTGHAVQCIRRGGKDGALWTLLVDGAELPARGVALTVPAPRAAALISDIAPESAEALRRVEYLGVICEGMLLQRPLTPYYVLNLIDRPMPFTGVVETSNLAGTEEFGGHALVYLPRYCTADSSLWQTSDGVIHNENMEGLRKVTPGFSESDVIGWSVNRARYVQPVQSVGRWKDLPPVTLAQGLVYLSTAQIYPWPVFNDEVVRNVDSHLPAVLAALGEEIYTT